MENVIVIIGGSFNPPTLAHIQLMESAVNAVHANKGIFVPASYEYVAKKMRKMGCLKDTLSNEIRLEMLESICKSDPRLSFSHIQVNQTGIGYDYEMLEALQQEFTESKIYFVTGSDKLNILPRWHRIEELLEHFHILVACRGENDLDKIKSEKPMIAKYWDRFKVFEVPEQIRNISSSTFREKLHNNDKTAKEMVSEEVWQILNKEGKIPWNTISDFHQEGYEFLSNFYEVNITYRGLTYQSTEAAFQAQKCINEEEKIPFTVYSPGKSKSAGKKVQLRPDWEEVKVNLMEEIVREKFVQNPDLGNKLLQTENKILVEGNRWGDQFWGIDVRNGKGKNHLGKILMKVREELKENIK